MKNWADASKGNFSSGNFPEQFFHMVNAAPTFEHVTVFFRRWKPTPDDLRQMIEKHMDLFINTVERNSRARLLKLSDATPEQLIEALEANFLLLFP